MKGSRQTWCKEKVMESLSSFFRSPVACVPLGATGELARRLAPHQLAPLLATVRPHALKNLVSGYKTVWGAYPILNLTALNPHYYLQRYILRTCQYLPAAEMHPLTVRHNLSYLQWESSFTNTHVVSDHFDKQLPWNEWLQRMVKTPSTDSSWKYNGKDDIVITIAIPSELKITKEKSDILILTQEEQKWIHLMQIKNNAQVLPPSIFFLKKWTSFNFILRYILQQLYRLY